MSTRARAVRCVAVAIGACAATLGALGAIGARVARTGADAGERTTYVVRTRCISDAVRAKRPEFFADGATITGARLVRHNLREDDFFEWDSGLVMEPVTYEMTGWEWDWEDGRYVVETADVNWEWGFALENDRGEHFYEIGKRDSPMFRGDRWCRAVVKYGSFFNRLVTRDAGYGEKIDYVFGSCQRTCPEIPFMEWPLAARERETQRVLEDTPNELGSEFSMYGTAGTGVCQFDIFVEGDDGNPDNLYTRNRLLHFLPADSRADVHTNSKKAPASWTGEVYWLDASGNKYWPTQFGPRGDRSSDKKWRVRMVLKETAIEIYACDDWLDNDSCELKSTDPYFNGQNYADITGVGMTPGYASNLIPGDCDFFAKRAGPQKNLNY